MHLTAQTYLIVCPLIFFAGFVDAIAGGGGLISTPAYLFAGLPIHYAYGTNKMTSSFGSLIAALQFAKNGSIRLRPALISAAAAIIGAGAGSRLVMILPADRVQLMLMICLPIVAILVLFRKQYGTDQDDIPSKNKEYPLCAVIGAVIGVYDGLIGPGTGTFLLLSFTSFLGYSMITATANAKVVNLASNTGALVTYIIGGKVLFTLGIPCILCSAAGNYLGSKMAIKRGSKFIRPVMMFVMILLFIKVLNDFLG